MNVHEYGQYDGLGLADLVRRKEVRPSELGNIALQAIGQVNPELNAVIAFILERADQVDDDALPNGPFRGVPFLIKDLLLHAAGIPSDSGSRLFQNVVLPHDTELMARFKQAGLVTIGRTNTPELGNNVSTEPVLHGPTRNPWDPSKSAGGSSGGSAAAVAARLVPLAYANDGGGSIRCPASACGVVGLKPTRGRISTGPDTGELLFGLAVEFAVSRSVRDSAALLDAVHGPGVGDPYGIAPPGRPYLDEVTIPPGQLKVAFTTTGFNATQSDPACVRAVDETARLLESLGHRVVEAAPQLNNDALLNAVATVIAASIANTCERARLFLGRTPSPDNLEATTWACYQYGVNQISGLDVLNALAVFNRTNRAVGAFMREYDVLMTPTLPTPPVALGYYNADDKSLDARGWIAKLVRGGVFTGLCNITGQPAISLPLQQTSQGLPIGIQFAARFGDEATLFRLAGQLEQAQPWIGRQPPLSV